ncbi:type IV secretion system protein [Pseudomonas sp. FYR_7]|uniref:type IV secretion system protein n=1 Tax=Pseudomonas sp. FYR_7 TaxID=3367174 RepID=UPI00370AD594
MTMESNFYEWVGGSIDSVLNGYVQLMAHSVIDNSSGLFVAGGGLFFMILGLLSVGGFIEHPLPHVFKLMLKWVFIGALALNADTYLGWVVEAIRGLEVGLADAFSPNGKGVAATSVYQVIDRAMTDGFDIASDLIARAGRRGMTEVGMILYDWLIAGTMIIATFLITLPAGAIIITAKVLLAFLLGCGPLFIALLLFGQMTSKWFDQWFAQVMTYIIQCAAIMSVLTLGMKFFSTMLADVKPTAGSGLATDMLEILALSGIVLYMVYQAYSLGGQLAGGLSSSAITLRQMAQAALNPAKAVFNTVNPMSTRRDLQSGMMTTARGLNHMIAGNSVWNPAYRQHVMQNLGKNWGRARGGKVGS